ncbi:Dipeptidase 1 [Orchesella cincta]|uniref:Dipeptidase n=1 Tax=Orchesella cincta TaxID=48709 RepID=A0A1D2NDH2_ORCCI|nr:Dipeptidase 1 [Orchesella cincta]
MDDSLTPTERARVILYDAPLIDGKNDVAFKIRKLANNDLRKFNFSTNMSLVQLWKYQKTPLQTDLFRLKAGGVRAQIFAASAGCDSQYKDAVAITLEQIDVIKRLISNYSSSMMLVNNTEDIATAVEDKKIASIISIEGGHSIQSSLGILRQYYELGVRMMTLANGCNTPWIDYSKVDHADKTMRDLPYNQGLTKFGQDVVAEMNRLGMIIDISHTSTESMKDVLKLSEAPIVFSHSAARNICDSEHNLNDDILELVREKNAVIMITFNSRSITCNAANATLHHVIGNIFYYCAEHIEYIKTKASVDNIGIGSNFDGMDKDKPVKGLEDVSKFPMLFAALVESGWDYGDLEKLAGKNFFRVFTEVEKVLFFISLSQPVILIFMLTKPQSALCTLIHAHK